MKRVLRSLWPHGYVFLLFAVVFIVGIFVFCRLVFTSVTEGHIDTGAGIVIGALWAWFMGKASRTIIDSGKEWISALEAKDGRKIRRVKRPSPTSRPS